MTKMNRNHNFADYIANALTNKIYKDTPEGDFVEDTSSPNEQTAMTNINSWEKLRDYLESRNAHDKAIQAAKSVWHDYENTL